MHPLSAHRRASILTGLLAGGIEMVRFGVPSANGDNDGGLALAVDGFTVCRLSGKTCLPGRRGRLGATVIFISSVRGCIIPAAVASGPVKNTDWGRMGEVAGPEPGAAKPLDSLELCGCSQGGTHRTETPGACLAAL